MVRTRRLVGALLVALTVALAGFCRLLVSSRVDDVPFSPVFARGRVGAEWATREGIAGNSVPGELERFAVYDREADDSDQQGFDSSVIHPEIRRFYERTADYDLAYETQWHPGFRVGAWLASFVIGRLEQLALPGRGGEQRWLESEIATVSPGVDSRGSRVWTRTDTATGSAVFVALYATHERDGVTYANVAVPLPWANLSTVLRPDALESRGDEASAGVRFTTRGGGDGGLYLVTPVGAVALPMDQRFQVWPVNQELGASRAPTTDATLVATHEMWLFGRQFLTISYGIE